MKKLSFTAVSLFIGLFSISIFGQEPSPLATPPEDNPVKITTSLIQLDVVVTDKDGKPVTDLKPEDFKILQDGKPQAVTSLSYVNSQTAERTSIRGKEKDAKKIISPPANVRTKPGRIVTFVLDDGNCMATVSGTFNMLASMKKFVDEQMLPDDRVGIYRTKGGTSLLQLYTSNKEVLLKKIAKINLLTPGSCGSAFDPTHDESTLKDGVSFESDRDKNFKADANAEQRENQVIGTIGVLNFVIERLRNIPQRKIVFLLSEGIIADTDTRTRDALRSLADKAARSSVVINTMSSKGLTIPGMITSEDDIRPSQTDQVRADRIKEEAELNNGLSYLAYATGGSFVHDRNFLENEIRKILDAETGYFLVGYEPDDGTFKGKEFHHIEIKLNRTDLRVSSRKGFYGRTDKNSRPIYKSADSALYQAIDSPLQDNGMDMQLTILYGNSAAEGNFIRPIFHISGNDVTLTDEPGGTKKAELDVVAMTLDEKGAVVDEFNRSYTTHIPKEGVDMVRQNGLDFVTDISIKKPGVYSVRVAVRDKASGRLGSGGDFVDISDLKKDKFFISGLITTGVGENSRPIIPEGRPVNAAFSMVPTLSVPSIRQFSKGSVLAYAYTIYNAKIAQPTGKPDLTRQLRLYRDGKLVFDMGERPLATTIWDDPSRIEDFGTLRITDAVAAGEYALQIIVHDKTTDRRSAQWIDFEVVN
jgi:VWFA-related protein